MVTGLQPVVGFISIAFGDPSNWINIKTVSIFTLVSVLAYIILATLFKYRRILWMTAEYQMVPIVRFGKNRIMSYACGLLVLFAIAIFNDLFKTDKTVSLIASFNKQVKPVFNQDDKRFKILILPWLPECKHDSTYDIGRTIQQRFDELGRSNQIPFLTYLTDAIDYRNFTSKITDSLLKFHNADIIIYGSYSLKACEGGTSDRMSFNYKISRPNWRLFHVSEDMEYKMEKFEGLQDIRKDNGMASVDNIIYQIAGIAEIKQYNFTKAIKMLEKIRGYEQNEKISFLLSTCYHSINNYVKSQMCLRNVLDVNPANNEAIVHLGVTYFQQGKVEDAKKCFEDALKYCPNNVEALSNLGRLYYAKKDSLTARVYLARITKVLRPDTDAHLAILAIALSDLEKYPQAKDYLQRALQIEPRNTAYLVALAEVNMHLKDTTAAVCCYNQTLEIEPNDEKIHSSLAWLYNYKRDYVNSQLHFRRAIELNPRNADAWASLALDYFLSGDKVSSLETIQKALILSSNDITVLFVAAHIYKQLKNYDKYSRYLEAMLKQDSTNSNMWNDLGIAYNKLKKYPNALSCFIHTLKLNPENAQVYYNLAATYSLMHQKQQALSYLEKAVSCNSIVKRFPIRDSNFLWLRGNIELSNIIYSDSIPNYVMNLY